MLTDSETFTLTVNAVNDNPVLTSIGSQSTNEDTAKVVTLSATDIENDGLTFTANSAETNVTATVEGTSLTLTPADNWNGTADITVTVTDDGAGMLTDSETFTLTVNAVNDAPTDLALNSTSVNENSEIGTTVGTLSTTDVDSDDSHSYTLVSGDGDTDNASFTINGINLNTDDLFNYETKPSYAIRIQTTDSESAIYAEAISITVTDMNDAPVLAGIPNQIVNEDMAKTVMLTASDEDGDFLVFSANPDTTAIIVEIADGTLTLTPADNWNGTADITVTVTDDGAGMLTDSETFTLTVNPVNDRPIANVGSFSLDEDMDSTYTLTGNDGDSTNSDADNQTLSYAIVDSTVHGTLTLNDTTGYVFYSPDLNYNGGDSFTFRVTDNGTTDGSSDPLTSAQASVSITVNPINDAPVITSVSLPDDTLIYSNIDGQKQVIVMLSYEDIDSENLQIFYLDSGNVIDSYPISKSIDSTNIILDTLNYSFNHGEHELIIIILDDGDNGNTLNPTDSDTVNWNLAYPQLDISTNAYYLTNNNSVRTLPPIIIWNGQINSSINQANGIKLVLPDTSRLKWASNQDAINISPNNISFESVNNDGLTLLFNVDSNFTQNDSVSISNLRISQLGSVQGPTNLRIIIDGEGDYNAANAQSGKQITVGDSRVNFSKSDAYSLGDPDNIQSPSLIIWEESPYSVMNKDIGIHLKIPSTLHLDWNDTSRFDIYIFQNDGDSIEIISDSINISDSVLSIALMDNLASDDTVKIIGSLFNNFENVSFPSSIFLAVTTPEPEQTYSFERPTLNKLRIGNPTLISTADHILIQDIDSLYSDTLMPVQIIEYSDVASITKEKGIFLRLPENSDLKWDSEKLDSSTVTITSANNSRMKVNNNLEGLNSKFQSRFVIRTVRDNSIKIVDDTLIQLTLNSDLSPGDTLTIRRLPVKNILNNVYNEKLDCSTNGNISFNRIDSMNLSIGQVEIFSEDRAFLLNDTTQAIPIRLVQDSLYKLINQQYGVFLFIDDAFPVTFDTSQNSVSYIISSNQGNLLSDTVLHSDSGKTVKILLSNEIGNGDTLKFIDLRFSGFTNKYSNNNVLTISMKDSNRSTSIDSTLKEIGKPNFESNSFWALTGSETSIEMPAITVKNDHHVGIITVDKKISLVLSENDSLLWMQVPLLDISGAYTNINPEPIYSDDGKRISIEVTDNFSLEDSIIVNGLRVNVTGNVSGNVFLSLNETTFQDTIIAWVRSGEVSFNSSDQFFLKNVTLDQRGLSRIKIWQGEFSMIDSVNDLILRLPFDSYFHWYEEQNPIYSFFNDQTGSISDEYIISEDSKSLRLPVEHFPTNDTLFIDGLRFAELTSTDSIHLLLGLDGGNNAMILEDPALKIVAGFELDYESSWNFVLGDTGRFATLPDILVINDSYNTFSNTDVSIVLPDNRLTWKSSIDSIGIIQDSILIKYAINIINDTLLHIPRGMPILQDEMIKITGLQLNAITDTMNLINPNFIFSLSDGSQSSSFVNEIEVLSSVVIGIGNPYFEYDSNISIAMNDELLKIIPSLTITESSAPIFGPHRDLVILALNGLNEKLNFEFIENWNVTSPGFIKSVKVDTIIIGFTRNTNQNEIIQLIDLTMSTEPFFSGENYLNSNILSGSMKGAFGISYNIEQDFREKPIDIGPDIELYPSLLFSQPEFSVNNDQYQIGVYLFPSIIDNQNTFFNSVMDIKHSAVSGLFSNDLSEQFRNFTILHNQNYSFSDSLVVPFDKLIITMDPSVADTINKYADLNRYYSIENDLVLNLNRAELLFESNIDTTGLRIVRSEDYRDIDLGYRLDSIFLEPNSGIISSNSLDSLKIQLSEFPFERHLIIQNSDLDVVSDTVIANKNEDTIQLSGAFTKDGLYSVLLEGVISDSSYTIPVKRQFRLDNTIPSFNFDSTDSLALSLISKGKGDVGHLVATDQLIEISIFDLNETGSVRNNIPLYFFDDSLNIRLVITNTKNPEFEYEKNYKLNGENYNSGNTSISMTFDSLLSYIMISDYSLLKKDKHNFDFLIAVSDPAGNTNEMVLFFSVDLSGKAIGDEYFNYPNPFSNLKNEQTKIRYVLLKEQGAGVLYILDLGGDMVHISKLEDSYLTTGSHEIKWNGRNLNGDLMSSGVYLGLLKMDDSIKKIKIVIRN